MNSSGMDAFEIFSLKILKERAMSPMVNMCNFKSLDPQPTYNVYTIYGGWWLLLSRAIKRKVTPD